MSFYGKMLKQDILSYTEISALCNNRNKPDKTDDNYDRLWKIRTVFNNLSNSYAKYYNPYKQLGMKSLYFSRAGPFSNSISQRNTSGMG
jgi:hypothetical protein